MKVRIELDVEPDEFPLITELLTILRQLRGSAAAAIEAPAPTAAPQPTSAASPQPQTATQTTTQQPKPQQLLQTVLSSIPSSATPSERLRRLLKSLPSEAVPVSSGPGSGGASSGAEQLEQSDLSQGITQEVKRVMEGMGSVDEAVSEFFAAFSELAFSVDRVAKNQSILPYVSVLPRLPEPYRAKVRDRVIQTVLKHLTVKRPIDSNRVEFFAHAEAFAALVKVECVNISGAVATIGTLLLKTETRCAAVTMLGKTVELCLRLLSEKCDPAKLAELRRVLQQTVTEDAFRYDLNYIEENMGWAAGSAAVATTTAADGGKGSSTMVGRLVCKGKFEGGHTEEVYALCYDPSREGLYSAAKDGRIVLWRPDGKMREHVVTAGCCPCGMSVNPRAKSLLVCTVPKEARDPPPSLLLYGAETSLGLIGAVGTAAANKQQRVVSCVEAMVQDQGNKFATGESLGPDPAGLVRLYDLEGATTAASLESLQPVVSYREHEDFVSSLTHHPSADGQLFSGSRDGTVRMWDRRQAKSAALVGHGSPPPPRTLITCMHAAGCLLACGALDCHVRIWDVRSLADPLFDYTVDDTPVLRVAVSPQSTTSHPILAISTHNATRQGLYLSFPARSQHILALNEGPFAALASKPTLLSYALVWGDRDESGSPVLYAAGEELRKYATRWEC